MSAPVPHERPEAPAVEVVPTETHGRKRSAEEIERDWFENVYAGDDSPQLTFRAVFMGMILGSVMSLSNLYVGLKIGWSLGVAITACILSYAIFKVVPLDWMQAPRSLKIFDRHRAREVSLLENNCMQSTASAAGYGTGITLVSAFSAYVMITGHLLPFWTLVALVFFMAMLGVFLAIPMKRNMINVEQLPFPSGTAAAETLRSLHSEGAEASRRARGLFSALAFSGLLAWFRDGKPSIFPGYWPVKPLFDKLGWERAAQLVNPAGYTLSFEFSTIMAAAGAIMGMRTAASMLIGAVLNYGILAPWMHDHGIIHGLGFRNIVTWSVWGGVACMTSAGLLNFFWEWRTIGRAFKGLVGVFGASRKGDKDDPLARIEVPGSWFAVGTLVATVGAVALNRWVFHIPVLLGVIAVALSFLLAIVACRSAGETDVTPIGALGKITQLTYGVLIPQNIIANLMTANVTSSVAAESADLLTDLKSGYLLGANPRKQFLAQFFGVFAGALAATGGFFLLVRTPGVLGGDTFPAPAAQVWKAVAELLAHGAEALPAYALASIWIGLAVGAVLTLLEKLLPKQRKWIPSPTGIGLAFVVQGYSSISIFIGAVIAWAFQKAKPKLAETYVIPVASGCIAGESLIGILVAVLTATKVL